jgi:hypothetical protein
VDSVPQVAPVFATMACSDGLIRTRVAKEVVRWSGGGNCLLLLCPVVESVQVFQVVGGWSQNLAHDGLRLAPAGGKRLKQRR